MKRFSAMASLSLFSMAWGPALASAQAPATTGAVLQEVPVDAHPLVRLPTDAWITNGGNLFNQRFSPLTEINRDNVADLKGVWQARLNGSGTALKYSGEAQPIVQDGVVYVITGADDVFALDVDTGDKLWTYEADLNQRISTICCGWTSRGVGLGEGRIYVGQLDGQLVSPIRTSCRSR